MGYWPDEDFTCTSPYTLKNNLGHSMTIKYKHVTELYDLHCLYGRQVTKPKNICMAVQAINTLHMTKFPTQDIMLYIVC